MLWIARLWAPEGWLPWSFPALVALELGVPVLAERAGRAGRTPCHPHHIAERYGLWAIIVLGEVILSAVQAIQAVMAGPGPQGAGRHTAPDDGEPGAGGGLTWEMLSALHALGARRPWPRPFRRCWSSPCASSRLCSSTRWV